MVSTLCQVSPRSHHTWHHHCHICHCMESVINNQPKVELETWTSCFLAVIDTFKRSVHGWHQDIKEICWCTGLGVTWSSMTHVPQSVTCVSLPMHTIDIPTWNHCVISWAYQCVIQTCTLSPQYFLLDIYTITIKHLNTFYRINAKVVNIELHLQQLLHTSKWCVV